MASSGTETQWPGQGLRQGPCRRCWAWTQEQDTDGSTGQDSGNELPPPEAASPELLEDFHRVQQHPPPLKWDPDMQESGESSREEIEVDDVSSPEGSTLPLPWLPRHNQPLDVSEEESDETPRSSEAEASGESCPGLECEDQGDSSPVTLGQGTARGWVTTSKQSDGHGPSGHAKAHPSVELSPARSWSSGTVSLGHPSDSLNSTWEGDADVLQSTTLTEAQPQKPGHHFPHPDDRSRGGEVALATPTEFRDSLAAPTQNSQCSTVTWGQETTSLPNSLPKDPTWKRTKTSPKPLPSRFTGSISPLSTRRGPVQKVGSQHKQGATLAGHSSSDSPKYGRGRLNYPLPDFSKVGPRVRFPKDESYRPPKSRGHNRQPQGPTRPLIFKSPAEIVQEVLLSSGEASLAKDPPPAHPITRVPQEFQTPEQATELVHQLQEDYHKLLTKYAEAENTIDQLRLGAKVHLYSDPPKPSQSIHSGLVPQGSKILSFTIPQPRSAEWWSGPAQDPQASGTTGWPPPQADLKPSSSLSMPTPGKLPESQGTAMDQPSAGHTQALTSKASRLLAKVECFEELVLAGRLPPQDQTKGLGQLRAAHATLEEEYLQACREQHPTPQLDTSEEIPGTLDLCSEIEAEVYQLGQHLEELQDHMDHTQGEPEPCRPDQPRDITPATSFPHWPTHLPSGPAPLPAAQTYPEPAASCKLLVNEEVSPSSAKAEGSLRDLPAPPRDRKLQVEQDFQGLLERYLSVKSLPEALRMEDEEELADEEVLQEEEEKLEDEEDHHSTLEVDGLTTALGKAKATRVPPGQHLAQAEESHGPAVQKDGQQIVSVRPPGFQTSMARDRYMSGLGIAEVTQRGTKPTASHQSSLTSLEGCRPSENLPRKALLQTGEFHTEESWMASPETDSGFVGSETSRVSPLTQTSEHRLPHASTPGTSAQHRTATVPRDGACQPKARGPVVSTRATVSGTPGSQAQLHISGLSNPPQQGAHRSRLERALVAQKEVPRSEFKRQRRISEQLLPSGAISLVPPSTDPSVPLGPAESSPNLLLTRTERDQAIRDLQAEVSRLRLRLEDSLYRPHPGSPTRLASAFNHPTQTQDQPADSSPAWGPHCGSKSVERLSGESEGGKPAGLTGRRRARSSSVPRDAPRLSLSSESESPSPQLSSEKNRISENLRDVKEGARSGDSSRRRDRVSFRGQYTGQEYHVLSPKAVLKDSGTPSCSHCQPTRTQNTGSTVTRDPLGSSVAGASCCPLCGQVRPIAEGDGPSSGPSGRNECSASSFSQTDSSGAWPRLGNPAENTQRRTTSSSPSPKQKSRRAGSPAPLPPGLWYVAAAPPGPAAPPALAFISSAPVMPYPPATVYYATPAPTSALTASPRPARGPRRTRHSIQLDLSDLEELQLALSQAAEAAESVRCTTRQLSHSLSADLRHARSLRGSCLF